MKRRELLAHMQAHGCQLLREGANHSIWVNPATGRKESIPRIMRSSVIWRVRSAET
jgi:mRNA interferase HicA